PAGAAAAAAAAAAAGAAAGSSQADGSDADSQKSGVALGSAGTPDGAGWRGALAGGVAAEDTRAAAAVAAAAAAVEVGAIGRGILSPGDEEMVETLEYLMAFSRDAGSSQSSSGSPTAVQLGEHSLPPPEKGVARRGEDDARTAAAGDDSPCGAGARLFTQAEVDLIRATQPAHEEDMFQVHLGRSAAARGVVPFLSSDSEDDSDMEGGGNGGVGGGDGDDGCGSGVGSSGGGGIDVTGAVAASQDHDVAPFPSSLRANGTARDNGASNAMDAAMRGGRELRGLAADGTNEAMHWEVGSGSAGRTDADRIGVTDDGIAERNGGNSAFGGRQGMPREWADILASQLEVEESSQADAEAIHASQIVADPAAAAKTSDAHEEFHRGEANGGDSEVNTSARGARGNTARESSGGDGDNGGGITTAKEMEDTDLYAECEEDAVGSDNTAAEGDDDSRHDESDESHGSGLRLRGDAPGSPSHTW
ncbi:unnamed protein product, partial [Phaeothamnion confervicola]